MMRRDFPDSGATLSGLGGVNTGRDAAEFILLGSDTVQVGGAGGARCLWLGSAGGAWHALNAGSGAVGKLGASAGQLVRQIAPAPQPTQPTHTPPPPRRSALA